MVVCAVVVEGGDRLEGTGIGQAGHHTHLHLVSGLSLFEEEGELQHSDITVESGHGVDAALVEDKAVVPAVGIFRSIPNHGFVVIGHFHVLMGKGPAGRCGIGSGSGGGGVGVEIVGIREVFDMEFAIPKDVEMKMVDGVASVGGTIDIVSTLSISVAMPYDTAIGGDGVVYTLFVLVDISPV